MSSANREHIPHGTDSKGNSRLTRRTGGIKGIRKRGWDNLQEIRWILRDTAAVELPVAERKTIALEGRIVKDGVRKALRERQTALSDLVNALREYRALAEKQPLTLQGSDYAHAVLELNKAIDRAEGLVK
jgi:hypothetical protein